MGFLIGLTLILHLLLSWPRWIILLQGLGGVDDRSLFVFFESTRIFVNILPCLGTFSDRLLSFWMKGLNPKYKAGTYWFVAFQFCATCSCYCVLWNWLVRSFRIKSQIFCHYWSADNNENILGALLLDFPILDFGLLFSSFWVFQAGSSSVCTFLFFGFPISCLPFSPPFLSSCSRFGKLI